MGLDYCNYAGTIATERNIPHAKVPLPPAETLPFDPLGAAGNSEAEYWQRLEPVLESELGQRIQRIVEAKTMAATAENVAVEEVKLDEAGENERISDEPVIAEQGTDSQQSDGFFTPGTDSPNPVSRCGIRWMLSSLGILLHISRKLRLHRTLWSHSRRKRQKNVSAQKTDVTAGPSCSQRSSGMLRW